MLSTGVTGLVVDPNPDGIAWGVNYYLDNPQERSRLGRGGYNQVSRRFFWDSIAEDIAHLYREMRG